MKSQKFNIFILLLVLAIPFALSSQTRKAIPGGRYEALSGVKNSRNTADISSHLLEKKDTASLFWNEIINYLPENSQNLSYFSRNESDAFARELFVSKGIRQSNHLKDNTTFFYTSNLEKDKEIIKRAKSKIKLIVVKDTKSLSQMMNSLNQFDVALYQSDKESHYYLLKIK